MHQYDVMCIGLSVMTGAQINSAIRISEKYHENITIVWGGVHPTICPKSVLDKNYVDYIIRGDGERAFYEFLVFLEKTKRKNEDKEIEWENNKVHFLDDLNESVIDFDNELVASQYFVKRDGFEKAFPLETSRGCPHKCAFCHNSIIGHPYRTVATKWVIENIVQLYERYNIDGIVFQEDNFFLDVKRVANILSKLRDYRLGWKANSRLSYFKKLVNDSEIMKLIIDSHCHVLQFGIESGSERILKLINKGISVEDIIQVNRHLADYDIAIRYNFIVGFPTESKSEIQETIRLIEKLSNDNPNMESPFVNIYTPYPGTTLYELAKKEGFHEPSDLEGWARIVWNYPDATLYKDKNLRDFLFSVSNDYLAHSAYPR